VKTVRFKAPQIRDVLFELVETECLATYNVRHRKLYKNKTP